MLIVKILLSSLALLLSAACFPARVPAHETGPTFCCRADNDLFRAYSRGMGETARYDAASDAVDAATTGSGVLLLADDYPNHQTQIPSSILMAAIAKDLRLYIEFPAQIPGLEIKAPKSAKWERVVINSPMFASELPPMSILTAHACVYSPVETSSSLIAIARVAGFDKAVYGLPDSAVPALLQVHGRPWLIATTGLSHFQRGRCAIGRVDNCLDRYFKTLGSRCRRTSPCMGSGGPTFFQ